MPTDPAVSALPEIRAAVFDMDGLLIDTEPIWRRVMAEVFDSVGLHLSEAQLLETMGVRIAEIVDLWYSRRPWTGRSPVQVTAAIEDGVIDHVLQEGEANPGVHATMALLRKAGFPMAIASSSSVRLIDAVVQRLGLQQYVDAVCSADAEAEGKPHPAVYLTAARKLGMEPQNCLAFEDSPNGVLSAKGAGMYCITVPDPNVANDPRIRTSDLCLNSLEDFTPSLFECLTGRTTEARPDGPPGTCDAL